MNEEKEEKDCCRLVQKREEEEEKKGDSLLYQLERRIKARHVQLGGILECADEHLIEARRLLKEGRELGAREQLRMSLEYQAQHKEESAKLRNLTGLRKMLKDAKQNLTMAELLKGCTEEVRATLDRMPDVRELQGEWDEQRKRVTETIPETVPETFRFQEDDLPSPPTVTDQQVAEALERLRTPIIVVNPKKDAVRVPLLLNH